MIVPILKNGFQEKALTQTLTLNFLLGHSFSYHVYSLYLWAEIHREGIRTIPSTTVSVALWPQDGSISTLNGPNLEDR